MLFSDERITLEADEIAQTESYDEESLHMRQLLKTKLVDMDLIQEAARKWKCHYRQLLCHCMKLAKFQI
jgi:hypothetical protein